MGHSNRRCCALLGQHCDHVMVVAGDRVEMFAGDTDLLAM